MVSRIADSLATVVNTKSIYKKYIVCLYTSSEQLGTEI